MLVKLTIWWYRRLEGYYEWLRDRADRECRACQADARNAEKAFNAYGRRSSDYGDMADRLEEAHRTIFGPGCEE
jgi:hypothetical protein